MKNLKKWSESMQQTFGDNGIIAVSYVVTSFFRDIIAKKLGVFPILYIEGKPMTGKTLMLEMIRSFTGSNQPHYFPNSNIAAFRNYLFSPEKLLLFDAYESGDFRKYSMIASSYHEDSEFLIGSSDGVEMKRSTSSIILSSQEPATHTLNQRIVRIHLVEPVSKNIDLVEIEFGFDSLKAFTHKMKAGFEGKTIPPIEHMAHYSQYMTHYNHDILICAMNILISAGLDIGFSVGKCTDVLLKNVLNPLNYG